MIDGDAKMARMERMLVDILHALRGGDGKVEPVRRENGWYPVVSPGGGSEIPYCAYWDGLRFTDCSGKWDYAAATPIGPRISHRQHMIIPEKREGARP